MTAIGGNDERREHPRFRVDAVARVRVHGEDGPGVVCRLADASMGGVALHSAWPPEGARVGIEVVTREGEPVGDPLLARVLRVDAAPGGGYWIACQFEVPPAYAESSD